MMLLHTKKSHCMIKSSSKTARIYETTRTQRVAAVAQLIANLVGRPCVQINAKRPNSRAGRLTAALIKLKQQFYS